MLRKHNNGYKECDKKNLAGAGNILKAVLCGEDRKLDRWLYKSVILNGSFSVKDTITVKVQIPIYKYKICYCEVISTFPGNKKSIRDVENYLQLIAMDKKCL